MSFSCNITVHFSVHDKELLLESALAHYEKIVRNSKEHEDQDAKAFLKYVADGNGVAEGPHGGMCSWGYVGDYVNNIQFVDSLREFIFDLHHKKVLGCSDAFVVMFQGQQAGQICVHEVTSGSGWGEDLVIRSGYSRFPLFEWVHERGHEPQGVHTDFWEKSGDPS